jgi:hypothetical protein
MIKRPVLELGGGKILVGFKPELYEAAVTAGSRAVARQDVRRPR